MYAFRLKGNTLPKELKHDKTPCTMIKLSKQKCLKSFM